MDLITALFSVARDISNGDIDELNKLNDKAKAQVSTYHTESENKFAQLYAKLHKGWIFQLALVFLVPFVTVYILKKKNEVLTPSDNDDNDLGYEDEDELEHLEYLKNKYE